MGPSRLASKCTLEDPYQRMKGLKTELNLSRYLHATLRLQRVTLQETSSFQKMTKAITTKIRPTRTETVRTETNDVRHCPSQLLIHCRGFHDLLVHTLTRFQKGMHLYAGCWTFLLEGLPLCWMLEGDVRVVCGPALCYAARPCMLVSETLPWISYCTDTGIWPVRGERGTRKYYK
jgi:hypothetical protein